MLREFFGRKSQPTAMNLNGRTLLAEPYNPRRRRAAIHDENGRASGLRRSQTPQEIEAPYRCGRAGLSARLARDRGR